MLEKEDGGKPSGSTPVPSWTPLLGMLDKVPGLAREKPNSRTWKEKEPAAEREGRLSPQPHRLEGAPPS